jgi:predicted ATP-dependent endonuclease of OLD family
MDSGTVKIEDRVTVLIGKNEQGKSNFLRALASFGSKSIYTQNDFPRHLLPDLAAKDPKTIPMVTLWLIPEKSDRERLEGIVQEIDSIEAFKITRYYDGHYEYSSSKQDGSDAALVFARPDTGALVKQMQNQAEALKGKLTAQASRLPAFALSVGQANAHIEQFVKADFNDAAQIDNVIKTFTTSLTALPGQDPLIQADLAAAVREFQKTAADLQKELSKNQALEFEKAFPHFILHSSLVDKVPDAVTVSDYVVDPEKSSKPMANLCAVAGLSTQKIKELAASANTSEREAYEDHFSSYISGGINEFWTQEKYYLHFRIEKDTLSVSISDETYTRRIAPSERSDGFQWYLSFYSALVSEASLTASNVLLLDNPGLELHSDGQRDIKRFLEEKLPPTTQVIYVTHSPAMIDTYALEQVRKVEILGANLGTKIGSISYSGEGDLLEPVRSAIGASLVSSLAFNNYNVLVEGAADKPILEGAFAQFKKDVSGKILINGSVAETSALLPRFYERAGLPFVVCLDGDSGGRQIASMLRKFEIPEAKIVGIEFFADELGGLKSNDFELEDVLDGNFYHAAVKETYPQYEVDAPKGVTGKRTVYYESAFKKSYGIGFNKRRVGETVKKLLLEGKADPETSKRLKKLTSKLWEALTQPVKKTTK